MNAQIIDWNDLQLVMAVCREGTLSGAARKLGFNHSTVFRRINLIEEKLGVRLFERLPRGYSMTKSGEAALGTVGEMESLADGLIRKITGQDLQLSGDIRVAVPDALLLDVLMPHISNFADKYPEIRLEIIADNSYADLTRREADIAVRVTTKPAENLFGRKLCTLATRVYYHKKFEGLHGTPPMETLPWLMPEDSMHRLSTNRWLAKAYPGAVVNFKSNSLLCLLEAAKQGLGAAPLPCFMGDKEPTLMRTAEVINALGSEIWLLTHIDLKTTARIRAFMDHISRSIGPDQPRLEGTNQTDSPAANQPYQP